MLCSVNQVNIYASTSKMLKYLHLANMQYIYKPRFYVGLITRIDKMAQEAFELMPVTRPENAFQHSRSILPLQLCLLTFTALKQKVDSTTRTAKLREILYSADTSPAAAEIQISKFVTF